MKTVKLVWNSATLILFQASAQHQTDCFQHTQRTGQSAQKVLFTSWPRSLGVLFSPPGATKVTTVVIWTALLQLCIISVFHATSHYAFSHWKMDRGSLTCAMILKHLVHMKARWALMSLLKSVLSGSGTVVTVELEVEVRRTEIEKCFFALNLCCWVFLLSIVWWH